MLAIRAHLVHLVALPEMQTYHHLAVRWVGLQQLRCLIEKIAEHSLVRFENWNLKLQLVQPLFQCDHVVFCGIIDVGRIIHAKKTYPISQSIVSQIVQVIHNFMANAYPTVIKLI